MTLTFLVIVICVGLYRLKKWLSGEVAHHPEWQTMDALDRLLSWFLVVGAIWLCVGWISYGLR